MKSIPILFPFLFICLMSSCDSVDKSPINITFDKTGDHEHITNGVWLDIPSGYKKATSYDGYQAPNYQSSIAVKTIYKPYDLSLVTTDQKTLKKKFNELLENRPVKFPDGRKGQLITIKDSKKGTTKVNLLIENNSETILVKSFYMTDLANKYANTVRRAVLSTYVGEVQETKGYVNLAILKNLESAVYTKDGEYPTKSPDGYELEESIVDKMSNSEVESYLQNQITKLIDIKDIVRSSFDVSNGRGYLWSGKSAEKKVILFMIMSDNNDSGIFINCHGNENFDIRNETHELKKRYLKSELQ